MYPFININCNECNNSLPCNCKNSCGDPMLSTNLVGYQGPDLLCTDIKNCDSLSVALQKIDNIICTGESSSIDKTSELINDGEDGINPFISSLNINNFVRVLEIPINLLSGFGTTEEQICEYILALSEEERTILETDSKWNVIIISTPVQTLTPFLRSSETATNLGHVQCESGITISPTLITSYHDGSGILPVLGDKVFIDEQGVTPLISDGVGIFVYNYTNLSNYKYLALAIDGTLIIYSYECL